MPGEDSEAGRRVVHVTTVFKNWKVCPVREWASSEGFTFQGKTRINEFEIYPGMISPQHQKRLKKSAFGHRKKPLLCRPVSLIPFGEQIAGN